MKTTLLLSVIFFAFGFSHISPRGFAKHTYIIDTTIITDNGYIKIVTNYKDGKKHGQETYIRNNGDTMQFAQYKEGKYDGKLVAFYEGHKIATIQYFREDYKLGEWLHFDTLGNIKTKTIFDKPFLRTDPRWSGKEIFYEKEKEIFTQVWTNGRRSGTIIHNAELYRAFQTKDMSLGNKLFIEECASCHTIKRDLVGPALSEPVNIRSQEWLLDFIRSGDSLYKAGDKVTKALYEKYYEINHPDFTYLIKDDVEAIIKYIQEKK